MQLDSSLVIFISIGFVIMCLIGWISYLHVKISRLLKGKNARSLEDTLVHAHKEITDLREFEQECLAYFENVEKRLSRSVQAVETIRFNPFKGTGEGGNQSFATALVNEHGDGVIVSSLYSRDRISIFSKPLSNFKSMHDLTEEENHVVTTAFAKLADKQNKK